MWDNTSIGLIIVSLGGASGISALATNLASNLVKARRAKFEANDARAKADEAKSEAALTEARQTAAADVLRMDKRTADLLDWQTKDIQDCRAQKDKLQGQLDEAETQVRDLDYKLRQSLQNEIDLKYKIELLSGPTK